MVTPWKIIAASLIIFAAGVVTGGLTLALGSRFVDRGEWRARSAPPGSPERMEAQQRDLLRRMERQLSLNPEQRDLALGILSESHENLHRAWQGVHPATQQEYRKMRARLRDILNPEQQRKFDESFKTRPKAHPDRGFRDGPRRGPVSGPEQGDVGPDGPPRHSNADGR